MTEFLAMGGYAAYVWGAYGFTTLVLVWTAVAASSRHRAELRRLNRSLRA
jgi:heme exporter protein D